MEAKPYIQTLRWTSQKGLLTLVSFIVLALVSEFFIVSFFAGSGLTSIDMLAAVLLFVAVPTAVIAVLVGSWMYLTKYVALGRRTATTKASKPHRRQTRKTKKSTSENLGNALRGVIGKIFVSDSSAAQGRLSFSKAAVEGALTVLVVFLLAAILLSVLVYPRLFTDFAIGFYNTSSFLQKFMQNLANALVPLASGLNSIAPGFRDLFGGLASASASAYTEGNIVLIYVICQSVAAGISALCAFAYIRNITGSYHR